MDRGAWWAIVHGAAKSWTHLSFFFLVKDIYFQGGHQHFCFMCSLGGGAGGSVVGWRWRGREGQGAEGGGGGGVGLPAAAPLTHEILRAWPAGLQASLRETRACFLCHYQLEHLTSWHTGTSLPLCV